MQMRKNGTTVHTLEWNWARRPGEGALGWKPDRLMHIASVSKLITGIGMARLLDEKGISFDAKIIDYLPAYWTKAPAAALSKRRPISRPRTWSWWSSQTPTLVCRRNPSA